MRNASQLADELSDLVFTEDEDGDSPLSEQPLFSEGLREGGFLTNDEGFVVTFENGKKFIVIVQEA